MTRKHLQNIAVEQYVYGKEHAEEKWEIIEDLSEGVNPFGAPSNILDVFTYIDNADLHLYPDLLAVQLKKALRNYWDDIIKLGEDEIFFAPGSLGVLERVNKFMFDVGDRVLGFSPQYPMYINELKVAGVEYFNIELPKKNRLTFTDAVAEQMIKRLNSSIHAVYLDSPNNPTGQFIPFHLLEQVVEIAWKNDIPVIIDEAYGDFLPQSHSALVLLNKFDNVIVVRSFSKGFGLAGIRVGYGICRGKYKEAWQKVDIPATLSTVTTRLAAYALKRTDYLEHCRSNTRALKQKILAGFKEEGFVVCTTHPDVPLLTLCWDNPEINLHDCFLKAGILTTGGNHFKELGNNYVRIRIPEKLEVLMDRLSMVAAFARNKG